MERILKIENGEAKLMREELSLIPEFATILSLKYNKQEGDVDGRKRFRATSEFTYLWYMYSHLSPYREYSESERHEEATVIAGLSIGFTPSDELKAAIVKYKTLNETRILKLIRAAEKAVDNLRAYFEAVDFTEKNANGVLVNKPADVIKAIVDLDKVATGLDKLAARQKTEVKEGSATRGGQEDGWIMEKEYEPTKRSDSADESEEEDS